MNMGKTQDTEVLSQPWEILNTPRYKHAFPTNIQSLSAQIIKATTYLEREGGREKEIDIVPMIWKPALSAFCLLFLWSCRVVVDTHR